MNSRLLTVLALPLLLIACADKSDRAAELPVLARGANIAGANGMHFSPDGLLYVTSVIGSNITVLNPDTGEVVKEFGVDDGVTGPDDVAFAPDGSFFWTSIFTGEVAGIKADGTRVVAAMLNPGVNPITFADDGRLFVSQCFYGTGLYELDPRGVRKPRVIADDLGPGCGLNGMDWGPDRRLYGPRWFRGEVVSFDVFSRKMRVEASGFDTPAAVKFDSKGQLHVLDTGTGEVIRMNGTEKQVIATLTPGLDNFAFDDKDRLFVSSFTDGFVKRVEADGSLTVLQPSGLAHPGGLALFGREVVVADLHSIRFFDSASGAETRVQRNIIGTGDMGSAINIARDGANLILVSWADGDVRVWNPTEEKVLERYPGLSGPVAAVRFGTQLIATEQGTNRVISLEEAGPREIFTMTSPAGLVIKDNDLYVTDREDGSIYHIGRSGEMLSTPALVASGLTTPEGIAVDGDGFVVIEGLPGNLVRVDAEGDRSVLGSIPPGSEAASPLQPSSWMFNGVAVDRDGAIYATGEASRTLYKLSRK